MPEPRLPVPRGELRDLRPAVHGGDAPAGVIDFSTGVSPLPPPPALLAAIRAADVTRYPHPTALPLRQAIGDGVAGGPGQRLCLRQAPGRRDAGLEGRGFADEVGRLIVR